MNHYTLVYPATGVYRMLVHRITGEVWGHTADVFAPMPRVPGAQKIEALASAGRVVARKTTFDDCSKDVLWREYREPMTEMEVVHLQRWFEDQVGKRYDFPNLFWGFLLQAQKTDGAIKKGRKFDGKWHCSELSAGGAEHSGRPVVAHLPLFKVSPGHHATSVGYRDV